MFSFLTLSEKKEKGFSKLVVVFVIITGDFNFVNFQCRDTYWVESFNNTILIYCPKRIHFADRTFNMRMALAVMDWVSRKTLLC